MSSQQLKVSMTQCYVFKNIPNNRNKRSDVMLELESQRGDHALKNIIIRYQD